LQKAVLKLSTLQYKNNTNTSQVFNYEFYLVSIIIKFQNVKELGTLKVLKQYL